MWVCRHLVVALFAAFLSLSFSGAQGQPKENTAKTALGIAGDWQGTLDTGAGQLHLVLHIAQNADGTFKSTLDSVDQGANGMAVTTMSLKDRDLNFAVASVHGTYEGKVDADATLIEGTWTQAKPLALNFKRAAKPSDIDGIWQGAMDTGAMKLRIVLHISATPDGLTASMKSPDQGESVIPASTVSRNGADVKMEFNLVGGVFIATLSSDLLSLDGTWSQGGSSLPLHLKKTTEEAAIKAPARPQNPKKPYPYREVEVKYANKTAPGVTLAATLTIPQGKGPFPAVVLITGSGPQDRDESLMGHKPFLVLSDYLTRHGTIDRKLCQGHHRGLCHGRRSRYRIPENSSGSKHEENWIDWP